MPEQRQHFVNWLLTALPPFTGMRRVGNAMQCPLSYSCKHGYQKKKKKQEAFVHSTLAGAQYIMFIYASFA